MTQTFKNSYSSTLRPPTFFLKIHLEVSEDGELIYTLQYTHTHTVIMYYNLKYIYILTVLFLFPL